MKKKKTIKILAAVTALVLLGFLLWMAQGLLGNPLSRVLADRAAEKYLAQTYPDLDLKTEKAYYSFKTGGYYVQVSCPDSVDTHFSLAYNLWGKLQYDSYESSVTSGWNTWERLETEYRQLVEEVVSAPDFPLESEIDYGTFASKDVEVGAVQGLELPALDMEDLTLDGNYDIWEMGAQYGQIVYYAEVDGALTVERAAEVLRVLKQRFDKAGVPFFAIDLTIQEPRPAEDAPNQDRKSFSVGYIPYDAIETADLEDRVAAAAEAIAAYYARMDAEKLGGEGINT